MPELLPQNNGVQRLEHDNFPGTSSETDDMSNIVASIASEVLQKVNTTDADQERRRIDEVVDDKVIASTRDTLLEEVPMKEVDIVVAAPESTDTTSPAVEGNESGSINTDVAEVAANGAQFGLSTTGEDSSSALHAILDDSSNNIRLQRASTDDENSNVPTKVEGHLHDKAHSDGADKANVDNNDIENSELDLTKSMIRLLVGTGSAADLLSDISSRPSQNDHEPSSFKQEEQKRKDVNNLELDIERENSKPADASHDEHNKAYTSNVIGLNASPSDENPTIQPMNDVLADCAEPESMAAAAYDTRQTQISPPPVEVEVPADLRDSESPVNPPSTVSNLSTHERESPVEAPVLPTLHTIENSGGVSQGEQSNVKENGQKGNIRRQSTERENDQGSVNAKASRPSPSYGIPPRSPATSRITSNYQGQTNSQLTESPLFYQDATSNESIQHPSIRPVISRQGSRAQEPSDLLDPPSVSGGASAINPATAMDVLTQHLLQNLEGKLVAQQHQQVLQQHQQYALQSAPSSLSGYSTPIGARSAILPVGTTAAGSSGVTIPASYAQSYHVPHATHVVSQNGHHINGYQSVNQPTSIANEMAHSSSGHPPAPLVPGKRSIKLELMEHSRSDLRVGRGRSYAASARDLFKGASSRHRREGSLFNSISKFRHSVEAPRTPLTSNESEETPTKKYISRGRITVCWYEGTTTTELQTHVRNSITRKLGRDVDNIRLLDPSSDYSEVVLTPYIPSGSEFVVRFTEAAPVRTVYKYGERAPDSPSAAPSPSPSTLELSKLPSLDLGPARKIKDTASLSKVSGDPTSTEKIGSDFVDSDANGTNLSSAFSKYDPSIIHEEETVTDSNGERVVFVQASRSQEKKHVIFVLANYFVLFLSFIAIMAELHERAPTWINEQYSQVQACAVDRDTLFECVSNGDVSGLIASFFLWVSKSTSFKRFFLFGFNTRQQLWIVIYESFVTSFCWALSYMFIRRGLNPDTRRNFLTKYWKDACYGALAGFNASFLKAVMKNLIPREAVEVAFVETQQLGLINILGRMFRPSPSSNAAVNE